MASLCVVGTGYVGLVTGAVLADRRHQVICVDKDEAKIEALKEGKIPIYEPGLEEMVLRTRARGRLRFTTDLEEAVESSRIIFIAVGTPTDPESHTADLSAVYEVAKQIGRLLKDEFKLVVLKSTVPVGTAARVRKIIQKEAGRGANFEVASNPEFLREGAAVEDALNPIRIVIGAPTKEAAMELVQLYAPFERPMIITSNESAELCKYACNVFLATKISFANVLAQLCERAGADVKEVVRAMGYDPRIGSAFLGAGLGYGGSCFPKDVMAFISTLQEYGVNDDLVRAGFEANEAMVQIFVDKLQRRLGDLSGKVIGLWGLAFKPNTDDVRFSRALEVAHLLLAEGAKVQAYDPQAMEKAKEVLPQLKYCEGPYEAAAGADAVALVTEWEDFRHLDWDRVREEMRQPVVFDGRNFLDDEALETANLEYYAIGR